MALTEEQMDAMVAKIKARPKAHYVAQIIGQMMHADGPFRTQEDAMKWARYTAKAAGDGKIFYMELPTDVEGGVLGQGSVSIDALDRKLAERV